MLPALKRSRRDRSVQFFSPSTDLANLHLPLFFASTTLSCSRLPRCLLRNLSASPPPRFGPAPLSRSRPETWSRRFDTSLESACGVAPTLALDASARIATRFAHPR